MVMAKAKKGEYLNCKVCGLVVVVDETCGCAATEILCCNKPMAKGKKPVAKKKPATKAAKAVVKTSAKAAAKAAPAKIVAKAKPAARKSTRTKK
jgi:hypothetical protein